MMNLRCKQLFFAVLLSGAVTGVSAKEIREVYLGNIPSVTEKITLGEYIRVYDIGNGKLKVVFKNNTSAPLYREMTQECFVDDLKQTDFEIELISKTGNPKLQWGYRNLGYNLYVQEIALPAPKQKTKLSLLPANDTLAETAYTIEGAIPPGKNLLRVELNIRLEPKEELEFILHSAAAVNVKGDVLELFNPYRLRTPYGKVEDFEKIEKPHFDHNQIRIYAAGNPQQLHQDIYQRNLVKMKNDFGDAFAIHFNYPLTPAVADTIKFFHKNNIPVSMEAHQSIGFMDYFTNNGLYLTNDQGFSMSDPKTWEKTNMRFPWPHHALDYSRGDEVMTALKYNLNLSARLGMTEYMDIDFVWPWNGRWGYGKTQAEGFRRSLLGQDSGIILETSPGEFQTLHFFDYLKLFTDIAFTPQMAGFQSWENYIPIAESAASRGDDKEKCNLFLFVALYHYELLKFTQQIGLYADSVGVDYVSGSNPEDIANGQDIYLVSKLKGVKKYGYEFFGSPLGTQAWYHNMRFYAGNLQKLGKNITDIP